MSVQAAAGRLAQELGHTWATAGTDGKHVTGVSGAEWGSRAPSELEGGGRGGWWPRTTGPSEPCRARGVSRIGGRRR